MAARLEPRAALSPPECEALQNDRLKVPPAVAAHGRAVADLAVRIGNALNHCGSSLDLHLIRAALWCTTWNAADPTTPAGEQTCCGIWTCR